MIDANERLKQITEERKKLERKCISIWVIFFLLMSTAAYFILSSDSAKKVGDIIEHSINQSHIKAVDQKELEAK